jgi:hypothetical protein
MKALVEQPSIEKNEQWKYPKCRKQLAKPGPHPGQSPQLEEAPSNPKPQESPTSSSTGTLKGTIPTKNQYEILSEVEEEPETYPNPIPRDPVDQMVYPQISPLVQDATPPKEPEDGEIEEILEDDTDHDSANLHSTKKLGRKSNNQRRETISRRDIDLGKQSMLDGNTKKEPCPTWNQARSTPPKGGNPKTSSK